MKQLALVLLSGFLATSTFAQLSSGGGRGDCSAPSQQKKARDKEVLEEDKGPVIDPLKYQRNVFTMALQLQEQLNRHASHVAVVSRAAGASAARRQFRNPEKQTYTHAGIAVKYPSGDWKFIHLLNTCGGPSSDIYEEGLAAFFSNVYSYDYAVGVPSEGLQETMAKVLLDGDQPSELSTETLHNPRYSNISNPFHQSDKFQNSNQWVLTVMASAQSGCRTIPACRKVYTERDFTPSEVKVKRKERLLKAIDDGLGIGAQPNVHLGDHTFGERISSWYRFVSAASIYDYVRRSDDLIFYEDFCHQAGCGVPRVQLEAVD